MLAVISKSTEQTVRTALQETGAEGLFKHEEKEKEYDRIRIRINRVNQMNLSRQHLKALKRTHRIHQRPHCRQGAGAWKVS